MMTSTEAPRQASRPREIEGAGAAGWLGSVGPYVAIARPDHWCKNAFMLLGVVLAYFYERTLVGGALGTLVNLAWGVAATCLVASSNYVLNEILDAATDRHHPLKQSRPIPSGRVKLGIAYAEWIGLGVLGLAVAYGLNLAFFWSAATLLVMGLIYNVPPVRAKDWPYVDVLTEAVNNPLRLLLGWFVVSSETFPPVSLLISYWMVGAFFMASKRFAEYRTIGDVSVAGAYRNSFRLYDENKLLITMFFYALTSALFLGVFIVRYHLELILSVPLIAGFLSYYVAVSLKKDSAAQRPEKLHRERGLMVMMGLCVAAFVALMFVEIPALYDVFNVTPPDVAPLWRIR